MTDMIMLSRFASCPELPNARPISGLAQRLVPGVTKCTRFLDFAAPLGTRVTKRTPGQGTTPEPYGSGRSHGL